MGDTLDTLRQLVDAMKQQSASHEMAYPNAQSFALPASAMLKGLELPPIEKSVKVLSLARGQYRLSSAEPRLVKPDTDWKMSSGRFLSSVLDLRGLSCHHGESIVHGISIPR